MQQQIQVFSNFLGKLSAILFKSLYTQKDNKFFTALDIRLWITMIKISDNHILNFSFHVNDKLFIFKKNLI